MRWRCFQDDMTRGPSSTLDTLKFEASLGAYLKLNLMTYYMEHQYAFAKHPKIGPAHGSLTAEELAALVRFVKPLHLDILGNQQSFGHFGRILPDFGVATTNIRHFVRDGVKHGALGMLNTDWEDDGEALNAVKWHADAWAAECAWNAAAPPPEAFHRRVGAVLFGEENDPFGQAVALLSQTHRMPSMDRMLNRRFWQRDFVPTRPTAAVQAASSNLLAVVRPALEHLGGCRREARCNRAVLDAIEFGARRMEWIGERMRDGLDAAHRYQEAFNLAAPRPHSSPTNHPSHLASQTPAAAVDSLLADVEQTIRRNRDTVKRLGRQFERLWLSENRPYALDWTLGRYTNAVREYDGWLNQLADRPVRAFLLGANHAPREVLAQLDAVGSSARKRLVLIVPGVLRKGAEAPVHVYLNLPAEPAQHFVTFAGRLETDVAETMNRLQATLDLKRPVAVRLHAMQAR
ncbi:MAG: hypothetical protein JXQ71_07085 [Verrucomicrobia bacterium]|nr:hypothetical protein [Verrucomicrobiota bacterium]